MRLTIDTAARTLTQEAGQASRTLDLYSREAFELISRQWLRVGWAVKHPYTFTWQGRPIIQLPEDLVRTQEVIHSLQPDVIIETGVAHGGSLVFYASLLRLQGRGRVIGIDIDIRPHNRAAIETHPLAPAITLVQGSSTSREVVEQVHRLVRPGEKVLVFLDSNHSKGHVLSELEAYHDLVSPGSYIVATDGIMEDLYDVPRGAPSWSADNPSAAAREFVSGRPDFAIEAPKWAFNESPLGAGVTHWPGAWVKRLR